MNEEQQGGSGSSGGETVGPAPTGGETVGPAPGAPLPPATGTGTRNTPLIVGAVIAVLVVLAAIIGLVMR